MVPLVSVVLGLLCVATGGTSSPPPSVDWLQSLGHAYVVAMPNRQWHMEEVFAKLGVKGATFVDPVDRDSLDLDKMISAGRLAPVAQQKGGPLTKGDVATVLSHCKAMRMFLDSTPDDPARVEAQRAEVMILFEDDIDDTTLPPLPALQKQFRTAVFALGAPSQWDVYYLGRCWDHCWLDKAVRPGSLVRCHNPSCMHAVALTRRAAKAYLARTEQNIYAAADDVMTDLISGKGGLEPLRAFASTPSLFRQDNYKFGASTAGRDRPPFTVDCKADLRGRWFVTIFLCTVVVLLGVINVLGVRAGAASALGIPVGTMLGAAVGEISVAVGGTIGAAVGAAYGAAYGCPRAFWLLLAPILGCPSSLASVTDVKTSTVLQRQGSVARVIARAMVFIVVVPVWLSVWMASGGGDWGFALSIWYPGMKV